MPAEFVTRPIYYTDGGQRKVIEGLRGERGPGYDDTGLIAMVETLKQNMFSDNSAPVNLQVSEIAKEISSHLLSASDNVNSILLKNNKSYKAFYIFAPRDGYIKIDLSSASQIQLVIAQGVTDGFDTPTTQFTIPCGSHARFTKADGTIPNPIEVHAGDFIVIGCNVSGTPMIETNLYAGMLFLNDDVLAQTSAAAVDAMRDEMVDFYVTRNPDGLWADDETLGDSSKLHQAFADLCSQSGGYVKQRSMGSDDYGNAMYYYETTLPDLRYGTIRNGGPSGGQPEYPIVGGQHVPYKTVILSGGIHGYEINPSYMLYNLLKGLIDAKNGLLRKMRSRIKFVIIPVACPSGFNGNTYENAGYVNVNRSFPATASGSCACKEAQNIKAVIDSFGSSIDLHMDVHTFHPGNFTEFTFTDSDAMAIEGCLVGTDIAGNYISRYPTDTNFAKAITGCPNTDTTCTKYTQEVYGAVAGTIEAVGNYPSNGAWETTGTRYIAMLLDYVVTMVKRLALD